MKIFSIKFPGFSPDSKAKSYRTAIIILCAFFIYSLSSCEPDEDDEREKYIGKWQVTETSLILYPGSVMVYEVTISASSDDEDEVIIYNYYNTGISENVYAIINRNNISIPTQAICDDSIETQGSGSYKSNNEIHLSFSVIIDNADEDNLTAVLVKK